MFIKKSSTLTYADEPILRKQNTVFVLKGVL